MFQSELPNFVNRQTVGKFGEDLACKFLTKHGFKILERNFRIRGGEIDIIAREGRTLVYVEVKTRSSHQFGLPEEAVTYWKIKFLERAAKFYRNAHPNLPVQERIDVVTIDTSRTPTHLKLIKNISF